jgi:hypothetical protein
MAEKKSLCEHLFIRGNKQEREITFKDFGTYTIMTRGLTWRGAVLLALYKDWAEYGFYR